MSTQDLILAYNKASDDVQKAVTALRNATPEDREQLESNFREAVAEAERCEGNMKRGEELDGAEQRFVPRKVEDPNYLGMDDKEVRSYSILRAIRAASKNDWREAGLEREASLEIAKRMGRQPEGFFVPWEVQTQRRDLNATADASGGYTVATDLVSFIDVLRNKMVVKQAGAVILTGLVGDVAIPKVTTAGSHGWIGTEGNAAGETGPVFGQVTMTPKRGGAYVDLTRQLLAQSSIDAENLIRNDLATICAIALDLAALRGDGTCGAPTGIVSTSGINTVTMGTASGGAPTWAKMVAMETEVAVDNADVGSLAYIVNAKGRGKLKATPRSASGNGDWMIWTDGAYPVNGYAAYVTNQASSALTVCGVSGLSEMFFGNWADLVIGQWGTLDILVDPYSLSTSGGVRVVALHEEDIAIRHPESFCYAGDVITT